MRLFPYCYYFLMMVVVVVVVGCVIIFTPPLRLQRQEPHIGLQARVSCFGALNTMDKKRKYSELNSNGGGAIYVAAGLPPDLPLEIVRQIF